MSVLPTTLPRSTQDEPDATFETVIRPGRGATDRWREIWRFRDLFFFLAWRDISVRYKQTVIGVAWSVLRPLLTMAVFTVVFGRIARLPAGGGVPYTVFVFAGILPWSLFSTSLAESSNALIGNANMISKVYFPRVVLPVSAIAVSLVDFAISLVLFLVLMPFLGAWPTVRLLLLPAPLVLALLLSLGAGLWISALNVKYRDFRYVVPFALQLGLYISPVGFSSHVVGPRWQRLYELNPMVGVIDAFRWCLLPGHQDLDWIAVAEATTLALILTWGGLRYFNSTERSFADVI